MNAAQVDVEGEPSPLAAAMTLAERRLLVAAAEGCGAALEFGCGGSTVLLLEAGVRRLTSVDSDPAWLARLGADPRCAEALADGRLQLLHADVGPTRAWGWPRDDRALRHWPRYWRDPWDKAGAVDLVLVDGRFRVACALAALPRIAPGARVLIHDFWGRQAYQGPVLRHFDLAGSAGTLALLERRDPIDAPMLAVDLAAHAFEPF